MKRKLEASGFAVASQRGSNGKFVRHRQDVVDTVIVPSKREIAVGTLHSILSQAHISIEEWERL